LGFELNVSKSLDSDRWGVNAPFSQDFIGVSWLPGQAAGQSAWRSIGNISWPGGPERIESDRVRIKELPFEEIGITAAYILIAGLWCVFSDDVCDWLFGAPLNSPALQTLKGINFVTTTGLLLYLVLRRNARNRRLAQEASRLSQERFESVALATTEAIWDWNLETNTIWWSDGIQKLFGYPPEDVSTKVAWWLERLHPEDKERVMRTIRQATDTGNRMWAGTPPCWTTGSSCRTQRASRRAWWVASGTSPSGARRKRRSTIPAGNCALFLRGCSRQERKSARVWRGRSTMNSGKC
jgi:PAS domain-containing protein